MYLVIIGALALVAAAGLVLYVLTRSHRAAGQQGQSEEPCQPAGEARVHAGADLPEVPVPIAADERPADQEVAVTPSRALDTEMPETHASSSTAAPAALAPAGQQTSPGPVAGEIEQIRGAAVEPGIQQDHGEEAAVEELRTDLTGGEPTLAAQEPATQDSQPGQALELEEISGEVVPVAQQEEPGLQGGEPLAVQEVLAPEGTAPEVQEGSCLPPAGAGTTAQELAEPVGGDAAAREAGGGQTAEPSETSGSVMPVGSEQPDEGTEPEDTSASDEVDLIQELQATAGSAPPVQDGEPPAETGPSAEPVPAEGSAGPAADDGGADAGHTTPGPYRPPVRKPSQRQERTRPTKAAGSRASVLPVVVRLLFGRGGSASVSLLASRKPGLPEDIVVPSTGGDTGLFALQDDWYQDVFPPGMGQLLREGVEWKPTIGGKEVRWLLSGREIYVLAAHSDLSGFVSTTRLMLGREHVVLCTESRLGAVRDTLEQVGCLAAVAMDSGTGLPPGWAGFRGVTPTTTVPQSDDEHDILNILRPLPSGELVFEGGIRLRNMVWLAGFPPEIRIRGGVGEYGPLTIDGVDASPGTGGSYTSPGWDAIGEHSVWWPGSSQKYTIREGAGHWDLWDAHGSTKSQHTGQPGRSRPQICGALVQVPSGTGKPLLPVVAPATNPVLVGPIPGQILRCQSQAQTGPAEVAAAFSPFQPVWALPADPINCDKRRMRVILAGEPQPVQRGHPAWLAGPDCRQQVLEWSRAILACASKGLATEPDTAVTAALWLSYKRRAKALRKSLK